jgi:arabinosaccharide transport system substrate-binding protein
MIERFPYGKAPFWLLAIAIASCLVRVAVADAQPRPPDLLVVTHTHSHFDTYKQVIPEFERAHGVTVQIQFANWISMRNRLRAAMLADTPVPDLFEALPESLGYFTRGPPKDVGLLDLTDRLKASHLDKRLVTSRVGLWTANGRVYGLPHDVHPVMLAYRRDLVESLGIDVRSLDTWDKFVEAGRKVTRDLDGDGVIDRYMIDLPYDGNWGVVTLLLQRGGELFDTQGQPAFDDDLTADTFLWYLRQTYGPQKIAYDASAGNGGTSQSLGRTMVDGLVLFYITPDWRSHAFEEEIPSVSGKMALMPMPAWVPGGRRTSVWGGTGMLISKATAHPDLAWDLATFLYYDPRGIGSRFASTNIIPVLKDTWTLPALDAPNRYYSNQPLGRLYANLADETPTLNTSPLIELANIQVSEAFSRCVQHYRRFGEQGIVEKIHEELSAAKTLVQRHIDRANALFHAE